MPLGCVGNRWRRKLRDNFEFSSSPIQNSFIIYLIFDIHPSFPPHPLLPTRNIRVGWTLLGKQKNVESITLPSSAITLSIQTFGKYLLEYN